MLRRNIDRLQGLVVLFLIVVVVIPIVIVVIVGWIADGCLVVVVVIVARPRAIRSTAASGHHALGARRDKEEKIDHAGGMRRF
ncbi:MAG TPA: hypothetical protein VFN86_00345 [Casimicrobiaceae bacterium]|nr:hypothetical protein [Casimicrobiaceae bacterium]